jgi:hypothetical protein
MTDSIISLETAHQDLGWPSPNNVFNPTGAGPRMYAALVRAKIGRALRQFADARDASIGILTSTPEKATTEAPLAIVVAFNRDVAEGTLRELQRLSWNFSHSPTLITFEPSLLRVWSCCEPPDPNRPLGEYVVHEIDSPDLLENGDQALQRQAAQALHWINLVSGAFFRERASRFERNGRADQMLLRNLRFIRDELESIGLRDDDVCHDLLARIVFVQFLFDRKDSDGKAALTPTTLARLHAEGMLKSKHENFAGVLSDYGDTYRLFDWLNGRFNGDLFPGKGDTAKKRESEWAAEKRVVTKQHLSLLADFIRGDLDMPTGQSSLWPFYAFDVIPLEFISSIYETFVTKRAADEGIFYTPPHLVDLILDRVLPWDSSTWDLRVLDPACGSGIFLVKAFQRLVHRWKIGNPNQQIRAETLRRLLENNLFGVDKDPHAVRVACFSLYLAMCDEIDPRHYWTQVVFPPMRGRRLIASDFFEEDVVGFQTKADAASYDLVIGNAPWGESVLTDRAKQWASPKRFDWPIANKDIGTLFLPKAAILLKAGGRVAMIQSASSILFNRRGPAVTFRQKLFTVLRIEEVINLSALRFEVFSRKTRATKKSVSPACIVVLTSGKPRTDERIAYLSPKLVEHLVDEFSVVVEPNDRRWLTVREAATDVTVWAALMWGNHRDRALLARLQRYPSLQAAGPEYQVKTREGIIFGDRSVRRRELDGRKLFAGTKFPLQSLLHLDVDQLVEMREVKTHSKDSTDVEAFLLPQLIIKQGWQKAIARFQARIATSSDDAGALCTQSYISVHVPKGQEQLLEAACLTLNSKLATYYLLLSSGRFASYRPEPLVSELLSVPLPRPRRGLLKRISNAAQIDERVFEAFDLNDAERVLVEDLFEYTLPDFKGAEKSPGRQRTTRANGPTLEPHLKSYCEYFIRVLKAGFGEDKPIHATIFQEAGTSLPYRLLAFALGGSAKSTVKVTRLHSPGLLKEFERLNRSWKERHAGDIYHERVARVYDGTGSTPTIFIVKPDSVRYWTRSAGLLDADEVAFDLVRWQQPTMTTGLESA